MARQESGLNVGDKPKRDPLLQDAMLHHLLLPALVGDDESASSGFAQEHRPAWVGLEITRPELEAVQQGEHESIRHYRAELLHKIQCQGWATGSKCVQKANLWIQPDFFKR